MFSTASAEEIRWAGETHVFQKVVGSQLEVKEDSASPGIQIADIVLWLYHQFRKDKSLPQRCMAILGYVIENGWESDFSFDGVERTYIQIFGKILATPISADQEADVRKMLDQAEASRLRSMAQYDKDRLPPAHHTCDLREVGTAIGSASNRLWSSEWIVRSTSSRTASRTAPTGHLRKKGLALSPAW